MTGTTTPKARLSLRQVQSLYHVNSRAREEQGEIVNNVSESWLRIAPYSQGHLHKHLLQMAQYTVDLLFGAVLSGEMRQT